MKAQTDINDHFVIILVKMSQQSFQEILPVVFRHEVRRRRIRS